MTSESKIYFPIAHKNIPYCIPQHFCFSPLHTFCKKILEYSDHNAIENIFWQVKQMCAMTLMMRQPRREFY